MPTAISKVLTVDDDPIFQELIKAAFAQRGIGHVRQAADEGEAIAVLNSETDIDLIVSDLLMLETDGVGLMRHMKNTGCQTPLIVVSSALEPTVSAVGTLAAAYQLRFLGALSKPLKFDQLESALASAGLHIPGAAD
ncbi:MAG: response regulator [Methyloligellaceae bacterium]